jgi:hypothetical protein
MRHGREFGPNLPILDRCGVDKDGERVTMLTASIDDVFPLRLVNNSANNGADRLLAVGVSQSVPLKCCVHGLSPF